MTNRQKLEIRSSEIRQRLNEVAGLEGDALTDEIRSESETLQTEYRDTETKLRAAIVADGGTEDTQGNEVDAEQRERLELRGKSRVSRFVTAAVNGRTVDGAEAEYGAAWGCPGLAPLEMFERAGPVEEHRAVTPGPATAGTSLAPIVPAIFQRSVAAYLGIDMPTVGSGDAGYPVLATSLTGGPKAESAEAAESAASFEVTTARPRRITGAVRFTREDAARLGGMEEALVQNLSDVLTDGGDNQALNGSGTGDGTLNGLLNILDNPAAPAAAQETFARYVTALASHVDGTFAVDLAGVRMLCGPQTYRHAAGVFRSNNSEVTAEQWLTDRTGGFRTSGRIAAPAGNIQQAVVRRANPAGDRVAVMPVWQGVELIRDPYSSAGKGEVVITGVMLVGDVVVLRSGAFVQDSFRLA